MLTCVGHVHIANKLPRLPANLENYNLRFYRGKLNPHRGGRITIPFPYRIRRFETLSGKGS